MFAGMGVVTLGCTLRVTCEVLAYQGYASWPWSVLPVSAILELIGLTIFAINLAGTLVLQPAHAQREPMVARISGESA